MNRIKIETIDFKKQEALQKLCADYDVNYNTAYARIKVSGMNVYDFYGVIILDKKDFEFAMSYKKR